MPSGEPTDFPMRVATAELAWRQARTNQQETLADMIKTNLELYRAGSNISVDWKNPAGSGHWP
jgi:hypothetical protein